MTSWRYLKVEAVPPLTVGFFKGPIGQKLENITENLVDRFIGALAGRIRDMDAEAERERIEKIAAQKAHEERVKAEAKMKEEARVKAAAEKAVAEAKKAKELAAKLEAEAKAAMEKEKSKEKQKGKSTDKPKGKDRKPSRKKKPPKK